MKRLKRLILPLCLMSLLAPQALAGQDHKDTPVDRAQAAARAKQYEKGRVLRVDQTGTKYRVKVLKKNGRVVLVDVDKRTGKINTTKNRDTNH
ncbi:PepSY domain-containing protein [Alteromonas sp. C1M14]|uniref:PepSY domain-containing protein n=1 Tax=Alteromonas sp. C1M14 TaxID=2841567 RepID=UPI001C0A32A1|nr:PepSY domain-containing protein [Alteromonas sp. C1M14]MBU2977475.1 PepSY domain-containing protein [Alteromonas sp. C1M14]